MDQYNEGATGLGAEDSALDFETGQNGGASSTVQDAAERVRSVAGTAAERLPAAVSSAQGAMSETQRALEDLPNQALVAGTSFSLGLAAGMFLMGTNRLLVLLAAAPAAAMAATLFNRSGSGETPLLEAHAGGRSSV